ncbi:phosphorylase [Photobacterium sp. SDRW27]|uniref:phosphorylase n=1 Tax=Photobacterium obscurum TaxID=2829490 RepID=UPI0022443E7A|nr:phosphorylase [Photobacterium obscurum]MCW8329745.1 phosphorylase [Photobacterium obscurum]
MFWEEAERVSRQALASGKLMPITTAAEVLLEGGVNFLGHVVTHNASKKLVTISSPQNPFLPYDPSLYVGEAGTSHVCLLNKFPVLSPHLLICSKDFVLQSSPLSLGDFHAWLLGFTGSDVLGFYNSGPIAGASQTHRHMQVVKTDIPLEEAIIKRQLPFKHFLYTFTELDAGYLYQCYIQALKSLLELGEGEMPYNILLTERWMLVVPRSTNNINQVFANGLNYSGRFLVKQPAQLDWLQQYGIMRYLTECGMG